MAFGVSIPKNYAKLGDHDFSFDRNFFCLAVPKYFVRTPFCISQVSKYLKILCKGGGWTVFRRRFFDFLSHITETFRTRDLLVLVSNCLCMAQTALACFHKLYWEKHKR